MTNANHIIAGQCFYCTKQAPTIGFRDYDGSHEICADCFRIWAETVADADGNGDTEWRNYREGVYAAITRMIQRSHEDPL